MHVASSKATGQSWNLGRSCVRAQAPRRWRLRFAAESEEEDENVEDPESPTKKPHRLKGRRKSVIHRLRMSQSHTGMRHSAETREKIRQSMRRYHQNKRPKTDPPSLPRSGRWGRSVDYFVMEKAVLELSQLRRDVSLWLEAWYATHTRKPSLDEVAEISPEVHNKFLRYIALQEFIRSNS